MLESTIRSSAAIAIPDALLPDTITMLAYGSLLSEASSRLTFPDLQNFRYVRVHGLRRVFAHPHVFLIQQDLVEGLRMASLSAEPAEGGSFVVAAFDVVLTRQQRIDFIEREASYTIASVPFYRIESTSGAGDPEGMGVICLRGQDSDCPELIQELSTKIRLSSIWSWPYDSGLLPADIYLRHCLLASDKASDTRASASFRQETFLADRATCLQDYLNSDDDTQQRILASEPPPHLATRFGG